MKSETVKQVETKEKTRGSWKKGQSGNPNGRPKNPESDMLREALEFVKKKNNKSFLQHFVERAYKSDQVAIALAKKILPDKLQGEGFEKEIHLTQIYIPKHYTREELATKTESRV